MAGEEFGISSNAGINVAVLVLYCISLYNVIELTLIIWNVFKRHSGCYFWSFVVATYGILSNSVANIFTLAGPLGQADVYVYAVIGVTGWACMVNGQSMVLWSRLHLILNDPIKLRLILYMIIVNAVLMQVPSLVLLLGVKGVNSPSWNKGYSVFEKLQVTVFFLQEVIISLIYIYETLKLSKVLSVMRNQRRSRRIRNNLICINVVIIIFDIGILALEYANQYRIQTAYKTFVYSVKLKMEFAILNKLVEMTTGNRDESTESTGDWAVESRNDSSWQSTLHDAPQAVRSGNMIWRIPRSAGAPPTKACCAQGHPVEQMVSVLRRPPSVAYGV